MKMPATAIREEICKSGVISFARFMEWALYCPETGYYETNKDIVGSRGDFITSVSVGPLFGELLAFQFAKWLESETGNGSKFRIVEAGAHGGQLAQDILRWMQANRAELFERIEYVIVEPSARRQEWQRETIQPAVSKKVRWVSKMDEIGPVNGTIFSNELLDAFPVHRFGWDAGKREWFEWGVALDGEGLVWRKMPGSTMHAHDFCPPELESVLPDGYIVERSPAAGKWWEQAAGCLAQGRLVTIDYGYSREEMFLPGRTRGTLRAYHRHRVADDVLANAGEQDLTAHINFTAIQKIGERAGLRTEEFCAQPRFLTRILQSAVAGGEFTQLDAKQARQFQTLTHPEHLGRAFRVLVQRK